MKLTYSVTRIGSKTIIGGKQTTVTLSSDRRRYRVTGLQANWQISMTIRGTTSAGDGAASKSVVAGKVTAISVRSFPMKRRVSSSQDNFFSKYEIVWVFSSKIKTHKIFNTQVFPVDAAPH